jgi:hypothetical protein
MFPNSRIERQRPGSISNARTRPNPIWPGPGLSGSPIRAVLGGRLCQATVNLTKGVPPISRNFLAINLWGRICLDLAVILAKFQRAFSKREYGGSNPAAPANQSGLCVWSAHIATIRAVAGHSRHLSSLWTPEFLNRPTILPEISRGVRRYSQITGDVSQRPVRS